MRRDAAMETSCSTSNIRYTKRKQEGNTSPHVHDLFPPRRTERGKIKGV